MIKIGLDVARSKVVKTMEAARAAAEELAQFPLIIRPDRKSTRLNSRHTDIYSLSLHDALPIYDQDRPRRSPFQGCQDHGGRARRRRRTRSVPSHHPSRSEEHTSELPSH